MISCSELWAVIGWKDMIDSPASGWELRSEWTLHCGHLHRSDKIRHYKQECCLALTKQKRQHYTAAEKLTLDFEIVNIWFIKINTEHFTYIFHKVFSAQVEIVVTGYQDDLWEVLQQKTINQRLWFNSGWTWTAVCRCGTLFCLCSMIFRYDGCLVSSFPPALSRMAFMVLRLGQTPGVR